MDITITEALAEVPTITKRIAKKQQTVIDYLSRPSAVRDPHEKVTSLRPSGKPDPVGRISLRGLSVDDLVALSRERSWYAPLSQMKVIQAHELERGRSYTDAEIEILVQSWSDHCYHTTWKSLGLLKKLMAATREINHPLVVSSFTDNAGGMDFVDGWVVTIKGASQFSAATRPSAVTFSESTAL